MIGFIIIIAFLLLSVGMTTATCYIDSKAPATGRASHTSAWRLYM
jgi:hypothetical protein